MKHDSSVDGLRFAGNVLIVLFHAAMFYDAATSEMSGRILWGISRFAWIVGMSVLCLVSGWCFFNGFDEQESTVGLRVWWGNKVFRRVKRLLIPYLVWGVVFVIAYRVMGRFSQEAEARVVLWGADNVVGCVRNVFNFTNWVLYGPLWYLRAMFFCALLSIVWALAFKLLRNPWGRSVFALLIGFVMSWGTVCFGLQGYPGYCMILFGAGGCLAVAYPNAPKLIPGLFARFAENAIVSNVLLPTGMFLYVTHLAVNRIILMFVRGCPITLAYIVIFVGSCVVPILTWHVLNKFCPKMLSFLEGRW